jgi:HK97 gp10 family phage protein
MRGFIMVGQITYKITGAKELERKLLGLGPLVATKIGADALLAGSKPITKEMRTRVPVKTGALKKSITTRAIRANGSVLSRVIGFKSPGRFYAHLVEFGTRHSASKPFVRPSIDANHQKTILEIGRRLFQGIEAYCIGRILTSLDEER